VSEALEVLAYAADGTRRPRAVRLPADPFDGTVHEAVLHQAVTTFLANQRQGTAQTKTRSFVTGGNQKPWRQKGTGRARQGSTRSPLWPGGGTMFGPLPRDYRRGIPRKVRRLARRSALNARARERAISVIAPLAFEEPKTRRVAELLGKLGIGDRRVLVLTEAVNPNLLLSARNIQNVAVMRFADASAYDILRADALVIEEPALGAGELESGVEASTIAPAPVAKAPRVPKPSRAAKAEAPKAKKAAPVRKAAEKKAPARAHAAPAKHEAPAKPAKHEAPARHEAAKKPAAKKPGAHGAPAAPAAKKEAAKEPAKEKKGKSGKKPGKKE
jgi:large subunit ribosomal protein L4